MGQRDGSRDKTLARQVFRVPGFLVKSRVGFETYPSSEARTGIPHTSWLDTLAKLVSS